jgi:hypothetical protein
MKILLLIMMNVLLASCSSFQASRIDADEADEKGLTITDNFMSRDATIAVDEVMKQLAAHPGLSRYKLRTGVKTPKVFVGEIQNHTSEAYFPIGDMNDEFLQRLSESGEFILIDAARRESILKEITYQNDGMVAPNEAKKVGNQAGADLMIFGNVYMKPETRKGKTIKEYSVNIRLTDIERGIEVLRTRTKIYKYSKQ